MTATIVSPAPVARAALTASTRQPPVLPDLLRSEWAKVRSVRSTYWTLAAAVAAMIGYGAINSASHAGVRPGSFDPILMSLSGVLLAQLAIGVLGILVITTEYSTGMIRSTFAAAPQRHSVIIAKAGVLGAAAFTVGTVASLIAFLSGQAIMGANGVSLASPGALRSVIGIGLYLGLLSIFAVALGTIIRRSAGAIAALVGLILILPALLLTLPASLQDTVVRFLPGNAGQAIFTTGQDTSTLSPWAGLAVFALYAAAALTLALVILRRRDA
jgi:ABC-type transport system involved in multi-copper enzyme maturation permease subunit